MGKCFFCREPQLSLRFSSLNQNDSQHMVILRSTKAKTCEYWKHTENKLLGDASNKKLES